MAFCTNCGNQVGGTDTFCAKCGTRQAAAAGQPPKFHGNVFFTDITPRAASMLCYIPVVGWIPSILVLASDRFQRDRTVRFHAFQGIYLFVIWLIVDRVISPIVNFRPDNGFHDVAHITSLLHLVVMAAWIFMLVKTSQQQDYHLPIVGELAERSVSEQR